MSAPDTNAGDQSSPFTPAEEVRLTCQHLGSQKKLAEQLPSRRGQHINVRTVRRWAAGKGTPDPLMLERIRELRSEP